MSLSYASRLIRLSAKGQITEFEEAIREIVLDAVNRGKADGLIVTGRRTGEPPILELLSIVKEYLQVPVLIGSGFNPDNAGTCFNMLME